MGLRDQLTGILPDEVLLYLSDHFVIIGDIAVLALSDELRPYYRQIAEAVVSQRKNVYTVLNRAGPASDRSRTPQYEILLGKTTITRYREFGFTYRLDVVRSFFSPRLAYERRRVTGQVEPGERVYVPFAGVGPFAIPAAARGAMVDAVELNPGAFTFLQENIALNHVTDTCHPVLGDALDTSLIPRQRYDRLIIPAPYGMETVLEPLLPLLSSGGTAHLYTFRPKEEIPALIRSYEKRGLIVTFYTPCGNVAPGISRWAFDLSLPL